MKRTKTGVVAVTGTLRYTDSVPTPDQPVRPAYALAHGVTMPDHSRYMQIALDDARVAMHDGNRPVASIIVRDGAILGSGRNTMFTDYDPSAHAEVAALRSACSRLRTLDLSGSTLYSTLEPCPMCFWAMQEANISRLVLGGRYAGIGGFNLGRYTVESFLEFTGRKLEVITGVLQEQCEAMRIEWIKAQSRKA